MRRWLLVLAGCASAPPAPLSHRAEPPAPAIRADAAFADALAPDYAQPSDAPPRDLARPRDLDLEACRAGDARSCWLAVSLGAPAGELVRARCRAGDAESCRAAAWADHTAHTGDALADCRLGMAAACEVAARAPDHTAALAAQHRQCELVPDTCLALAGELRTGPAARDAHERYAQFHADERYRTVYELVKGYRSGAYPEPQPGRRRALERWLASQKTIDI